MSGPNIHIPELSVVVLCYKSGKKIYGFADKVTRMLEKLVPSWELVLVGNYIEGDEDPTPDIVRELASGNDNIKAVSLIKEGMMGWDARSGMSVASGKYICLIDGDEQMPYRDILRVYRCIKKEGLDLVKTYRAVRQDGFQRIFISFVYNVVFSVLFPGMKARDINSKPKIMTRDAYGRLDLKADDWFLDAEIMIQARKLRFKIGEIPSRFYKCEYRRSFVRFSSIIEFLRNLFFAKVKEVHDKKK